MGQLYNVLPIYRGQEKYLSTLSYYLRVVARLVTYGFAFVLLLAAGFMLYLTGLSYEEFMSHLINESADGDIEFFTPSKFESFRTRAWVYCGLFAILAILFIGTARRVSLGLTGSWNYASSLIRKGGRALIYDPSGEMNWILWAVIAGAALIRIVFAEMGVTYDEAFSATYFSTKSVSTIMAEYTYPNNHILHTLFMKASISILGWDLLAMRLPALIGGLLLIPCSYLISLKWYGHIPGIVIAGLFALMPAFVEYSVLGRGYTLLWVAILSLAFVHQAYLKNGNSNLLWLASFVMVIGAWIHLSMVLVIASFFLSILLFKKGQAVVWQSVLVTLVGLVLVYSPVLLVLGPEALVDPPLYAMSKPSFGFTHQLENLWLDSSSTIGPIGFILLSVACLYGCFGNRVLGRLVLLTLMTLMIGSVVSSDLLQYRLWISLAVLGILGIGQLISDLPDKLAWRGGLVAVVIFFPFLWLASPSDFVQKHERFDALARTMSQCKDASPVHVVFPMDAPYTFYTYQFGCERPIWVPRNYMPAEEEISLVSHEDYPFLRYPETHEYRADTSVHGYVFVRIKRKSVDMMLDGSNE